MVPSAVLPVLLGVTTAYALAMLKERRRTKIEARLVPSGADMVQIRS
jgi:hypothetical protein